MIKSQKTLQEFSFQQNIQQDYLYSIQDYDY